MINFYKSLSSKIERLFIYVVSAAASLIYKENCVICGAVINPSSQGGKPCSKSEKFLCKTCLKTVEILSGFPQGLFNGVEIYSASIYEGTMRHLIRKLKFNHKKDVASVLADFLFTFYKKIEQYKIECNTPLPPPQNLIIIPVPTNRENISQRGYNNVLEIAKEFSTFLGAPYSKNLLIKIKNTKPQYKLNPKQREENVSGCFSINLKEAQKYKGKTLLIIDDIYTTGATVREIIKVLKNNNIENVFCITLSKALNKLNSFYTRGKQDRIRKKICFEQFLILYYILLILFII